MYEHAHVGGTQPRIRIWLPFIRSQLCIKLSVHLPSRQCRKRTPHNQVLPTCSWDICLFWQPAWHKKATDRFYHLQQTKWLINSAAAAAFQLWFRVLPSSLLIRTPPLGKPEPWSGSRCDTWFLLAPAEGLGCDSWPRQRECSHRTRWSQTPDQSQTSAETLRLSPGKENKTCCFICYSKTHRQA